MLSGRNVAGQVRTALVSSSVKKVMNPNPLDLLVALSNITTVGRYVGKRVMVIMIMIMMIIMTIITIHNDVDNDNNIDNDNNDENDDNENNDNENNDDDDNNHDDNDSNDDNDDDNNNDNDNDNESLRKNRIVFIACLSIDLTSILNTSELFEIFFEFFFGGICAKTTNENLS